MQCSCSRLRVKRTLPVKGEVSDTITKFSISVLMEKSRDSAEVSTLAYALNNANSWDRGIQWSSPGRIHSTVCNDVHWARPTVIFLRSHSCPGGTTPVHKLPPSSPRSPTEKPVKKSEKSQSLFSPSLGGLLAMLGAPVY